MATLNQPKRVNISLWLTEQTYTWLMESRQCLESINSRAETIIEEARTVGQPRECACGCGRRFFGSAKKITFSAACRKRLERGRKSQLSVTVPPR